MRATLLASRASASKFTPDNNSDILTPSGPRSRAATSSSRPPLILRDRNASMRVPPKAPLGAKIANGNMSPYEKPIAPRPLMPTLSTATKNSKRPPLTPRVAGATSHPGASPLLRRGAPSPVGGVSERAKEDTSTTVSPLLNHNVTPRSGPRKSRVDISNSAPTITLHGAAMVPWSTESISTDEEPLTCGLNVSLGMGMGNEKDISKRHVGGDKDSKFFFASEAKTGATSHNRPQLQAKSSAFFYANGESIPPSPLSSGTSAEERAQPKFFHANGTLDVHSTQAIFLPPPRPNSALSSSSRIPSTRPASRSQTLSFIQPKAGPMSPTKLQQNISMSLQSSPEFSSNHTSRSQMSGKVQSTNTIAQVPGKTEYTKSVSGRARSSSSGSTGTKSPSRIVFEESSTELPCSPLNPSKIPVLMPTLEEALQDHTPNNLPIESQSLIKAENFIQQLNELAANARIERKVLDLEITNSSLAAINRTLEREMRKQTAELRRYRRLSRSGRLSINRSGSVGKSVGNISDLNDLMARLSDMSEEEDGEEEEEEEEQEEQEEQRDDGNGVVVGQREISGRKVRNKEGKDSSEVSDEDTSDEGSLSPDAMAESDLRHRKRDERKLQLDLNKHQQLLIDSQKIKQTLKRCLGMTEELIGNGKKALAYKVRLSDIELGGRVLAPDDDNDGMTEFGIPLRDARPVKEDRDSGIDMDPHIREHI